MYYTRLKNICQVSIRCLFIILFFGVFLCIFAPDRFIFAQQTQRDKAIQAMDNATNDAIRITKEVALRNLKNKPEFKSLYNEADPAYTSPENQSLRARIEIAADVLAKASYDLIYATVEKSCLLFSERANACPPDETVEGLKSRLSDAMVNSFAEARNQGVETLNQFLEITEAHTVQSAALEEIEANIKTLKEARNDLLLQWKLVDGYREKAVGVFNNGTWGSFFKQNAIAAGINALVAQQNRINETIKVVDDLLIKLGRMRMDLITGTLSEDSLTAYFDGIITSLNKINRNIKDILINLGAETLEGQNLLWLVGKYNELYPEEPINMNDIKKGIISKMDPLVATLKDFYSEKSKKKRKQLKESLKIPKIKPKDSLLDNLNRVLPDCGKNKPKPSVGGSKGDGITGVNGIPIIPSPKPKPSIKVNPSKGLTPALNEVFRGLDDALHVYKEINGILYLLDVSEDKKSFIGIPKEETEIRSIKKPPVDKSVSRQ